MISRPVRFGTRQATADKSNRHGIMFNGVDVSGRYKFQSWGTWGWLTPEGVAACVPSAFAVATLRWFDPQGYAPNGLHYTDLALLWVQLGGNVWPASPFPAPAPLRRDPRRLRRNSGASSAPTPAPTPAQTRRRLRRRRHNSGASSGAIRTTRFRRGLYLRPQRPPMWNSTCRTRRRVLLWISGTIPPHGAVPHPASFTLGTQSLHAAAIRR